VFYAESRGVDPPGVTLSLLSRQGATPVACSRQKQPQHPRERQLETLHPPQIPHFPCCLFPHSFAYTAMSVAPVTSENAGNSGISVTGRRSKPVSYCTASSSSSVPPGKDPHRRTCTFSFRFLSEFRLTERARHHPGVMADVHDLTDRFIACRDVRPVLRVMSVLRFHAESGGPEPQCLTGHPAVFEAAPAPWQVHSPWKRTTDSNRNP